MENLPLSTSIASASGRGFYYAWRLHLGAYSDRATCVGAAERSADGRRLHQAAQGVREPLAAFRGFFPAAERFTDIETARLLTYKAA